MKILKNKLKIIVKIWLKIVKKFLKIYFKKITIQIKI